MPSNPKYYIIEASALPDVFLKVAEAKRLLDTGEVATVNEATRRTFFCDPPWPVLLGRGGLRIRLS